MLQYLGLGKSSLIWTNQTKNSIRFTVSNHLKIFHGMYVRNVANLLNRDAFYLSIAFNEENAYFDGKGKYRETPTGSVLYFSNIDEIQKLFSPLFHILELKNITIPGKNGNHKAYYALMQKK